MVWETIAEQPLGAAPRSLTKSACRQREARARRRRSRRQFCASCGETFVPTRRDARFCGNACRQSSYRQRKAARLAARRASIDLAAALIG